MLVEQTDVSTVKYMCRWPLGTPYPEIVNDVQGIMEALPPAAKRKVLSIDQTGVGAPVVDLFRTQTRPYRLRAVHITGGSTVSHDNGISYVPKRVLVSAVSVALQTKKLKITPDLNHSDTLKQELVNFKIKISPSGHDSYGAGEDWRVNNHDDLVLALAIALWSGSKRIIDIRPL